MPAKTLRVVTWNVWFGHWARAERQAALWAELERLAPVSLPTMMGRELQITRLGTTPALTVANVHLESTADETECRVRQLERIDAALADESDVVLLGDMNFPAVAERPENRPLVGWTDAWSQLRPAEPGYTIDSEINRMRWLHERKHDQRRIDRVFHRLRRWRVSSIDVIGREPLVGDPLTFISDHFGLCVDLVASE